MFWVPLIAAAVQYKTSKDTNKANAKEAQKDRAFQDQQAQRAMEFSSAEALANREFQNQQSSTAYQRSADDLSAAGLNRLISLGSPAATTSGAQGQSSAGSGSRATMMNPNIVESGLAAASAIQQIDNMRTQQRLVEAQARNVDANTAGTLSVNKAKEMGGHIPDMINKLMAPDASGAKWFDQAREGLTNQLETFFEGKEPSRFLDDKVHSAKDAVQQKVDKIKKDLEQKLKRPPPIYTGPRVKKISNSQFQKGNN